MIAGVNRMKSYFVYILASRKNGRLYTGVTNDVSRRSWEHRIGVSTGYTHRFRIKRLVYVEEHSSIEAAIRREKRIKRWPRRWKIDLIEKDNPQWFDLYRRLNRLVTASMPRSSRGMTLGGKTGQFTLSSPDLIGRFMPLGDATNTSGRWDL